MLGNEITVLKAFLKGGCNNHPVECKSFWHSGWCLVYIVGFLPMHLLSPFLWWYQHFLNLTGTLGIYWASISSFWLSFLCFLKLPCCFCVRNVRPYLRFMAGSLPIIISFNKYGRYFISYPFLLSYIFLPPVRCPQCHTVKPMNCTCTWGCDYTAGYKRSTYILCIVYISLSPLSFSPMLLFFVLIKCWVVSVWLSAKVWHGFRLAAERVSHDVPSLSSHQTPTHTHT